MPQRFLRGALLALFLIVPVTASLAQEGDNPVVARVNGSEITLADLQAAQQKLPEQFRAMPLDVIYPMLLDRMIDLKLVYLEGENSPLTDQDEVKRRLAKLREEVVRQVYLEKVVADAVTDEALRARYDEFAATAAREDEIRAHHILVKTEKEARDIVAELDKGADFETLARERSIGPSAENGGDLGYFTREQMVPEFADAAFALEPGQITQDPVKTSFGWHVIRVDDRRKAAPPTFEEAKAELSDEIARKAIGELVGALRAKADIAKFNPDGTPMKDEEKSAE